MKTLYYHHPLFLEHDTGEDHPESADRLIAIEQALQAKVFADLIRIEPTIAEDIDTKLRLIHSPAMIEKVLNKIPQSGLAYLDNDTTVSSGSKSAALLAVSAVCDAVDKVCQGQANNAFCAVRPGFCLFNNVAIAAEYARTRYQLERIAIIDFDVHHGNGTQVAFAQQAQVLYISSHQAPHYPGTGKISETGIGNIINLPLSAGTTGKQLLAKFQALVYPALKAFKPQLLFISAGFDAHKQDPLSDLLLEDADYLQLTKELMAIADEYAQGRIISVLEGGYHLAALASSVATHIKCLAKIG